MLKIIFNKLTIVGFGIILLGIYMLGTTLRDYSYMQKPAVDLYETTDWSMLKKGTHVTVNADFVYDYFYYRYDEKTNKETSRDYMIPNLVILEDGIYIQEHIAVMVRAKEGFGEYDAAVRNSKKWWRDTTGEVDFPEPTIAIDGYLREMKKEEKEALVQYISYDWGISAAEAEEYVCPYVIMPYDTEKELKGGLTAFGFFVVVGLLSGVMGVFFAIRRV